MLKFIWKISAKSFFEIWTCCHGYLFSQHPVLLIYQTPLGVVLKNWTLANIRGVSLDFDDVIKNNDVIKW